MSVEKWIGGSGVGLPWSTALNAADVNSLASASAVLSSLADITNGTSLDVYADFSVSLGSVTTVAPNYLGVYLFPLNQDGTTYGDGQFSSGTQTAKVPSLTYWVRNIVFPVGTQVCVGTITRIPLPPGSFRFLVFNQMGVGIAASSNTVKYRTYNLSVV
jgi:hypothetical protein